ncbi:MAG: GntR family transcriptional regulator [Actinomycetota bacterium]|nr:GntR family transcriptional regulator [Actinomycetota bacterium]
MPIQPRKAEYRQLADELRTRIETGFYGAGSMLPAEPTLAGEFGVGRQTVNHALQLLRGEGLVHGRRGVGMVVRELPPITSHRLERLQQVNRETRDGRGAFQFELESLGITSKSEVEVTREVPPADVAELLNVEAGGAALARKRRMFGNDIPIQLATGWYPLDIAGDTQIEQVDTGVGGTYSRLGELDHAPARFSERIKIRLATDTEAVFLQLDTEQRVYEIQHLAYDASGRVVEAQFHIMPAHAWELVYDWSAG